MEHKTFVGTSPRYNDEVKNKARELKEEDRKLGGAEIAAKLQEIYGWDKAPAKSTVYCWFKHEKNANSKDHRGPMEDFRKRINDFKGKKGTPSYTEFKTGIMYTEYLDHMPNVVYDKKEDYLEFDCRYCGEVHAYHGDDYFQEDRQKWQVDHIIPRHLKTPNNGMPENMALCCKECNQIKGEWSMEELLPKLKEIVKYQEKNNG